MKIFKFYDKLAFIIKNSFPEKDIFAKIFKKKKLSEIMGKKKYKKQLLNSLKSLGESEHLILESMTNLMMEGELKKNNINFEDGDTFSFKDNIFDYSEDKNIRRLAKLRRKMLAAMNKLVVKNNFKDKEIKFLS